MRTQNRDLLARFARILSLSALALGTVAAHASAANPAPSAGCGSGWVFFDLGNTLVDTRNWDSLKYMPGAVEYLRELRAKGFHLGLITNVPEDWGRTEAEKIATLQEEIAKTWAEADAFAWELFDSVLVPLNDGERKPTPHLFLKAKSMAPNCQVTYEGEDTREVDAARAQGLQGFVVGRDPGSFFPPADSLIRGSDRSDTR